MFDELDKEVQLAQQDNEHEWQIARLGKISPSNFGKIVKRDKSGNYFLSTGATAKTLIYKIAWERLLRDDPVDLSNGLSRLDVSSRPIEHGNDHEGEALLLYEEHTGNKVQWVKSRYHSVNDYLGGTPDAFVGTDGLVEVKCPWNGGNHLQTLLEHNVYNEEYIYQMQGYMWITGRQWCDFVTYDPALPRALQLAVVRVERNNEVIAGIKLVVDAVIEKIKQIETRL